MFETEQFPVEVIGIGVPKAGSRWVYKCLEEHPKVCCSRPKETHFFTYKFTDGLKWYKSCFAHHSDGQVKFEFSPDYLRAYSETIPRLKKITPKSKFVVVVRNPIARMRSSWEFGYKRGVHSYERLEDYIQKYSDKLWEQGLYFSQILNYQKAFGADAVHIIIQDQIQEQPLKVWESLCAFMQIDASHEPSVLTKKINASENIGVRSLQLNRLLHQLRGVFHTNPLAKQLASPLRRLGVTKFTTKLFRLNTSFTKASTYPELNYSLKEETYQSLVSYYVTDANQLSDLYGVNLSELWFKPYSETMYSNQKQ